MKYDSLLMNNIDTICISGGGVKGLAFIGALQFLHSIHFIKSHYIKNFVGTSVGSMISFILAIGYTFDELFDFVIDFNFQKLEPNVDIDNLFSSFGIDNGQKVTFLLSYFLKNKLNLDDVTFSQLFKITNNNLIIIGTNFSKGTETVFCHTHTPDMSVITAIRISSSIPIIFTPVLYNSDYYIDGALVNNFPIKYCNPDTTIGLYIFNSCCNHLDDITSLIIGCMSIITDTITNKDCDKSKYKYIQINNNNNTQFSNFNFDQQTKIDLINLGAESAKNYILQLYSIS
jgi:NTE family protein